MRKLLVFVVLSILLFSCTKNIGTVVENEPTQYRFTDQELVNRNMDELSRQISASMRGRPKPKPPKGGGGTDSIIQGKVCFLIDFDGHNESGMFGTFTVGNSGLTVTAQDEVFARVVTHFRDSFPTVAITRNETLYNSYPQNQRRRCVVTISYQWYPNQAGGVAYIGSMRWFDNTSCFAFSSQLGYSPKNIAEAVSHEIGHTINLWHQCDWVQNENGTWTLVNPYSNGKIMGYAYSTPVPIWAIGFNSNRVLQYDVRDGNNFINQ